MNIMHRQLFLNFYPPHLFRLTKTRIGVSTPTIAPETQTEVKTSKKQTRRRLTNERFAF